MALYRDVIMCYAPKYWENRQQDQIPLNVNGTEFKQVAWEVQEAFTQPKIIKAIKQISRIQNLHDLGQCLIREQLLLTANKNTAYYRVRRFIKINRIYLDHALKYNLDHRRCGLTELAFASTLTQLLANEVVLVVQVVTSTPHSNVICPSNNLEYFIDYVVTF